MCEDATGQEVGRPLLPNLWVMPQTSLAAASAHRLARDLALVCGAALATALAARVVVPLPFTPVPLTGQTFAVLVTAALLGSRRGAAGQALYVGLGCLGLPLFNAGTHGLSAATGGYLIGFVVAAWLVGRMTEGLGSPWQGSPTEAGGSPWKGSPTGRVSVAAHLLPAMLLGSLAIYACGVPWLALTTGVGLGKAIMMGALPFVPGDVVKAVAAALLVLAVARLSPRP